VSIFEFVTAALLPIIGLGVTQLLGDRGIRDPFRALNNTIVTSRVRMIGSSIVSDAFDLFYCLARGRQLAAGGGLRATVEMAR